MTTIKLIEAQTDKAKILFVDGLPENTQNWGVVSDLELQTFHWLVNGIWDMEKLPDGNWTLIGPLKDVGEETAKGVVDEFNQSKKLYGWVNYIERGNWCMSTGGSLKSLAYSLGASDNSILLIQYK